jgi:hypothetical protein
VAPFYEVVKFFFKGDPVPQSAVRSLNINVSATETVSGSFL